MPDLISDVIRGVLIVGGGAGLIWFARWSFTGAWDKAIDQMADTLDERLDKKLDEKLNRALRTIRQELVTNGGRTTLKTKVEHIERTINGHSTQLRSIDDRLHSIEQNLEISEPERRRQ